jgi:diguanylate cyclase (GGDEF)-like protein
MKRKVEKAGLVHIVWLDDSKDLLALFTEMMKLRLEDADFRIEQWSCKNPEEALGVLASLVDSDAVGIELVVDYDLGDPVYDGLKFIHEVERRHSAGQLQIIKTILSAYTEYRLPTIQEGYHFVAKGEEPLLTIDRLAGFFERDTHVSFRDKSRIRRYDQKTKFFTRDFGELVMQERLYRLFRDHQPEPLVVMMFDIDGLKAVNDSLSHDEGDKLIIEFGRSVRRRIRRGLDVITRWGGDEAVVMMEKCRAGKAYSQAMRIIGDIQKVGEQKGWDCGVSCGIYEYHHDLTHPERAQAIRDLTDMEVDKLIKETLQFIIAQADQAMYGAKEAGGSQAFIAPVQFVLLEE